MTIEYLVYYPKYCLTIQDKMFVSNVQTKAKVRNGGFKEEKCEN